MLDLKKKKAIETARYLNNAVDIVKDVTELLTRDLHTFGARFDDVEPNNIRINFTIIGETGRSYKFHIIVSRKELSYERDHCIAIVFSRIEKEFNCYDKYLK